MPIHFENLVLLFGLFALAIPIVLHLLQRRRHEILDWGAMQFLPESITIQRRRWLDEILLMLLRMAVIALVIFALATPIATSPWLAGLGGAERDTVIVVDGSYSMDVRVPGRETPWQDAVRWMRDHVASAPRDNRFSVLLARRPPVFLHEEFMREWDAVPEVKPIGNPDMPLALAAAWKHLQAKSSAPSKEIIVVTDGQRHGWADASTLAALDALGGEWHANQERENAKGGAVPSLLVVKVGADLPKSLPNYALAPLTMSRTVTKAGQVVNVRSALRLDGFTSYQKPRVINVLIDGQPSQKLSVPDLADLKKGQIPLSFQLRFDKEGQHVVSLVVEADDALMADNQRHAVIHVIKELPILLVDGDAELTPDSSTYFLQRALGARAAPSGELKVDDFAKPSVIVLADVPRLNIEQIDAIDRFLANGGGLLVVAGERIAKTKLWYNDQLYRNGQGWLPAKLDAVAASEDGVQPEARTFEHAALELFRASPDGVMGQVRLAKWWKAPIGPKDRATTMGSLSNGDPFLIEKSYKSGRVILCTVPPDRRWSSNLPSAWEYPVLMNELMYYLAGSRSGNVPLQHGEPIRLLGPGLSQRITLQTPESGPAAIIVDTQAWTYANTGAIGVYRVEQAAAKPSAFVVQPDLSESDLTRCTEDDWQKVRDRLGIAWKDDSNDVSTSSDAQRNEIWWLLLLGVVAFLCVEVWMTRRMALARGL